MLKSLEIKNYALIENLHIDFQSGLTIITGQTGAGKSVLLQALGLALGERADHASLRNAQETCVVEAIFETKDYDFIKGSELIIRRIIAPGGKSRIFVNDEPAKLEAVQAIAHRLVDIHSQHQHLLLKDEAFTLKLVDSLGGHGGLIEHYQKAYGVWRMAYEKYQNLLSEIEKNRADYDYLTHQLSEFDGIDLKNLDIEALEEEYQLQSGGAEIEQRLSETQALLSGSVEQLQRLKQQSEKLKTKFPKATAWHDRIESATLDMEDLEGEVRRQGSGFEYDPSRAGELETILGKVYALQKRYQVFEPQGLLRLRLDLESRIALVDDFESTKKDLEDDLNMAKGEVVELGAQLTKARRESIKYLVLSIKEFLPSLGMGESAITVEITPKEKPEASGLDRVGIVYAPHANMPAKPLASIASGGELSRIMLVLKVIMARHTAMPTILLDEIDIGVSGAIAENMGDLMKQMSQSRQVMAITHLAQVAGKGDHHIKIFKESDSFAAYTKMRDLSREDRIEEIAGMLSGSDITENAMEQARRLLES